MARINTFPEVIFVTVEEDGQNDWLSASLTKRGSLGDSHSAIVGAYKFIQAEQVNDGPIVASKRRTRATK